jgi:Rrf2 family protein
MQSLCRGNLLYSFRGRQGGFCLREGCEKVNLMQILTMVEGPDITESCVIGLKICEDESACPMHEKWKPIKTRIVELMRKQTLAKLASAVNSGKYRLTELPLAAVSQSPGLTKRRLDPKPSRKTL